jgi:hypothetical protein
MLKKPVLCLFFVLYIFLLWGQHGLTLEKCEQKLEQFPALLQSNIPYADSLLKSGKTCWKELNTEQQAILYFYLGYLCEINDEQKCFDQLLTAFELKDNSPILKAYKIGIALMFGKLPSERDVNILLYISINSSSQQSANAHYFLGQYALNRLDYSTAETHFKKMLELSKTNKGDLLIPKSFQQLALLESERHNYQKAFDYLLKALDHSKKNGMKYERALTDMLIGELLLLMDNPKEAKTYLNKSLELSRAIAAMKLEADILSYLGIIELNDNNQQSAINNFSLALSKYYKLNYTEGIAQTHLRLGEVYKGSKSYKLSKENYLLSQGYLEEINDSLNLGDAFFCLAEIEFNQGNFASAKSYIDKSLSFQSKIGNPFELNKTLFLSARINEKLGNHSSALTHLMRYTLFNDSIQNTDLKAKIAELNELYQAEQKEKMILQQSQELEELTLEARLREQKLENISLRNRQILFLFLSLLFASTAVLVWYKFKRKQENAMQLQQEAELKQTVLRSQMNPHFIFNSMSVIQSYIYSKDVETSSLFIVNFSRLMRLILENSSKEFIPLSIELDILEKYLLIQKLRFDGGFDFSISAENLDFENTYVPPMLTQPFIENAIEHGRLESIEGGAIQVLFSINDGVMKIVVEDNGVGKDATKKNGTRLHKSLAIDITKERIALINLKYNAVGSLEIRDLKSENSSGTRVAIKTYFKNINE